MKPAVVAVSLVMAAPPLVGCAGEAYVKYWGTVTEGAPTTYSFDGAPDAGSPIEGAVVEVRFGGGTPDGLKCRSIPLNELQRDEREEERNAGHRIARTDSQGRFIVEMIFGGTIFSRQSILLCADAAGHESFSYPLGDLGSGEPKRGERPINIVLAPSSTPNH